MDLNMISVKNKNTALHKSPDCGTANDAASDNRRAECRKESMDR